MTLSVFNSGGPIDTSYYFINLGEAYAMKKTLKDWYRLRGLTSETSFNALTTEEVIPYDDLLTIISGIAVSNGQEKGIRVYYGIDSGALIGIYVPVVLIYRGGNPMSEIYEIAECQDDNGTIYYIMEEEHLKRVSNPDIVRLAKANYKAVVVWCDPSTTDTPSTNLTDTDPTAITFMWNEISQLKQKNEEMAQDPVSGSAPQVIKIGFNFSAGIRNIIGENHFPVSMYLMPGFDSTVLSNFKGMAADVGALCPPNCLKMVYRAAAAFLVGS